MAFKTMLRQIIGKWGPMDTELQKAFEEDADEKETEFFSASPAPQQTTPQLQQAEQSAEEEQDDADFDFFANDSEAEA